MDKYKNAVWRRQIDNLARELSKQAIICDIELGKPGLAERILKNDDSICGKKNPKVFRQMRQHLMALFSLESAAIERLGVEDTKEILDAVRDAVIAIREAGSASNSLPVKNKV
jgi:hypothetical protein